MDGKPPPRRRPADLAGYLEALSRPVFQAGISWRVIDAKWEGIREAFAGFDPVTVAEYGPADIVRLLGDRRVVRSKTMITAMARAVIIGYHALKLIRKITAALRSRDEGSPQDRIPPATRRAATGTPTDT